MFRVDENAGGDSKKPNHVRRLNFGQSILTSAGPEQCQRREDRALWFHSNVANVSCATKNDFVRKWIETHDNLVVIGNEKSSVSPILGLSAAQQVQTSPVFGNRYRRGKRKSILSTVHDAKFKCANISERVSIPEEKLSHPMVNGKRSKICDDGRKRSVKRNLFDAPSVESSPIVPIPLSVSPVLRKNSSIYGRKGKIFGSRYLHRPSQKSLESKRIEVNTKSPVCPDTSTTDQSPVLGTELQCRKGKRRKLEIKEHLSTLDEANNGCVDANMNSVVFPNSTHFKHFNGMDKKSNIPSEQLWTSFKHSKLNSVPLEDSDISEDSIRSRSPLFNLRFEIENSPKRCAKSLAKMEIRFGSEDDENGINVKHVNDTSQPDLSDHIEDADTQELIALASFDNNISAGHLTCTRSESSILQSERHDFDSDRTYFSKAEQACSNTTLSVQSSPKISYISSEVTNNRSNGSSQAEIIVSTGTSPCKTNSDLMAQLTIMDSGKKRKKPKRGSLVEKLQAAINRQISFVRTWKHQLKQTLKQNTTVPCVTISVQKCTVRFGRQFLEGSVVEDRFSMLTIKGASMSSKYLTIITIPKLTGKIEMKSKGLIQIFPPWETLDTKKLVLNVTYIRTVSNNEIAMQQIEPNMTRIKRPTLKDFHCPCMNANKTILPCKNEMNKPNVMAKLMC